MVFNENILGAIWGAAKKSFGAWNAHGSARPLSYKGLQGYKAHLDDTVDYSVGGITDGIREDFKLMRSNMEKSKTTLGSYGEYAEGLTNLTLNVAQNTATGAAAIVGAVANTALSATTKTAAAVVDTLAPAAATLTWEAAKGTGKAARWAHNRVAEGSSGLLTNVAHLMNPAELGETMYKGRVRDVLRPIPEAIGEIVVGVGKDIGQDIASLGKAAWKNKDKRLFAVGAAGAGYVASNMAFEYGGHKGDMMAKTSRLVTDPSSGGTFLYGNTGFKADTSSYTGRAGRPVEDFSASGDLVFALHNLRHGG